MNTKNTYSRGTYKEKVEAELEMAKSRLEHLREKANMASADNTLLYRRQIDELEMRVAETKARLREMDDADDSGWENFKDGVERAWDSMKESMKDMVDSVTGDDDEHPACDRPADAYDTTGRPVTPRTPHDPTNPGKI